ncbi:MAG: hypothetical protein AABO41_04530 [Acidobacteriota bacterium]
MRTNSLRRLILGALLLAVSHLLIASSPAQVDDGKKFSRVPARIRARLVERFNLFIGYEHARQCDKLYEMIEPEILELGRTEGVDKAKYVDNCQKGFEFLGKEWPIETRVLSVHSTRRRKGVDAVYIIKVIEKFRRKGRTVEEDSQVWAQLIQGEWYLDHPDVQY